MKTVLDVDYGKKKSDEEDCYDFFHMFDPFVDMMKTMESFFSSKDAWNRITAICSNCMSYAEEAQGHLKIDVDNTYGLIIISMDGERITIGHEIFEYLSFQRANISISKTSPSVMIRISV